MRARGPASIYIALKGASSLFAALVYTVELVYLAQTVHLNPFQLVLAGTVQQAVSFLFQAPTGALADVYSRRGAVIAGFALVGAGFLLEGLIPALASALAAQALYGLGVTLVDGADAAWIADELGAELAGPIYLRATQIGWLATLPGIALSAALGSVRLSLPIVTGGALYLALAVVLALVMPETRFTPAAHELRSPWRQMGHTVRSGLLLIRLRPVLLSVLGAAALVGVFGAGFGQLWQYHLLHTFTFPRLGVFAPVVWFGIIEAVIALTSVLGIEIARRRVATTSHRAIAVALLAVDGLMLAGALCFALAGWFAVALAGLWLVTTAAGPRIPLENAWMNQSLDASVRATVFSLRGQVQSLAAIAGGPLLGALATTVGTRPTLVAAAVVLAPALLLYARALRWHPFPHAAPL
jgi:DHA3 family tetracycline resistance protein-like MFS transporter